MIVPIASWDDKCRGWVLLLPYALLWETSFEGHAPYPLKSFLDYQLWKYSRLVNAVATDIQKWKQTVADVGSESKGGGQIRRSTWVPDRYFPQISRRTILQTAFGDDLTISSQRPSQITAPPSDNPSLLQRESFAINGIRDASEL